MDNLSIEKLAPTAQKIADAVCGRNTVLPQIGLILGSGWGDVAAMLDKCALVPYRELPDMPSCGVAGHAGNFAIGKVGNSGVIAAQGRIHLYEGRGAASTVLPVRIFYELGVRTIILTNAAGGVNPDYTPGDLMILRDHINFTGINPLVGVGDREPFERFADMTEVYDGQLRAIIADECTKQEVLAHSGTYLQVSGPSYETPAEIRAFRALGADAVGMSTAIEAVYARYLGIRVAGISNITNMGAGLFNGTLAHADVLEESKKKRVKLTALMRSILMQLK